MQRLAIIVLFLSSCAVSEPEREPREDAPCTNDSECPTDSQCEAGFCARVLQGGCDDRDGDGFGIGLARSDCQRCIEAAECAEDCDDSDPSVHPGAHDQCDGIDNNCSGEIDEPQTCKDTDECEPDPVLLVGCISNQCDYLPPDQSAAGCDEPVLCFEGKRAASPACL